MAKIKKSHHTVAINTKTNWFDNLSDLKKDFISLGIIFLLVVILFNQIIFKNQIFSDAGDTAAAHAWAKAGEYLQDAEGQIPLWFPHIFSGMPGFGSLASIPHNVSYLQTAIQFVGKLLFLNGEMSWFVLHYFLAGIFMFMLARTWHFSHLASLLAAIVFMFSPYAVGLAGEGHGSKMMALSYIPLMLLLTYYLFEKRNLLSIGLLSVAIGTALLTNHVQMVYYGFMLIGLFFAYEFILNFKSQKLLMSKTALFFFITLILGFSISSYVYLSTYEYSQYSIRGAGEAGTPGGLNYDYATNWSFHPFEILNLLIPSFFGFSSPYYWGWMPFTNSTVYFGVVPIILSIIALIFKRNKGTIFFALFAVLLFLISFGKHFPVYDLFFNYLPFFNKFRAPAMILHLLPLVFGMLAAYGLTFFIHLPAKFDTTKMRKGLFITMGIITTILVISLIGKSTIYNILSGSMFVKDGDLQQLQQQYAAEAPRVLQQLKEIRFDMLWKDYIKFAIIALASLGLIVLFLNNKIKSTMLSFSLLLILVIDLLIIDTKYVDPKPKSATEAHFAPDQNVQFLKTDKSQYRIFPLGQLFMDNTWMYHNLESIGGYSPAKIKIYQDMIDSCLYSSGDPMFPINMNIVNMLNTKYLMFQGRLPEDKFTIVSYDQNKQIATYLNPAYQPRAFFVEEAVIAKNKTEVFRILNSPEFDSRTKAILEKQPSTLLAKSDSVHINTLNYRSNLIELSTYSNNTSLLVLSEVYYPAGWRAYIDGKETEIYKTNYVLRSIVVPAGEHKIEFIFDPAVYKTGFLISHIGWGISILLILVGLFSKKEQKK